MALAVAQSITNQHFGNVDTTNASFGSAVTAGSLVVVCVWGYHAGASATMWPTGAVTDNKGNTYNRVATRAADTNVSCAIYYAYNVSGGASFTITLDPLTTTNYGAWSATEITGATTTDPLDQNVDAAANDALATTVSSGTSASTTQANEIVFGVCAIANGDQASITVESVSPSWNQLTEELSWTNFVPGESDYRIISSTGTQAINWTYATAGRSVGMLATFKEAAAAAVTLRTLATLGVGS